MQRGLYPHMDAMMQTGQWYLLKTVTIEISIANFDTAGNERNRGLAVQSFNCCPHSKLVRHKDQ